MLTKLPPISTLLQFLTLACLPLYIIRFDLPIGPFNIPSTLLELMILLTLVVVGLEFWQNGLPWRKLKTDFDLLIGLFLVTALISLFISPDFRGGSGIFKAYFIEPILFYYSLIFIVRKRGVVHVLLGLVVSGCYLALLGLLQKLTGSFSLAPQEIILGRVTAVYNSANALALYLGPIIFICLAIFFRVKKNLKLFFIFLLVFFTLVIIWTKSRGGLVGEMISLLIFGYGLFSLKFKRLRQVWLVVPLSLIIVLTLFFYQMFAFYDSSPIFTEEGRSSDTLQVRFALWLGTANLLRDHSLLGAGLNGFKRLYSFKYKLSAQQEDLQYPHNLFLNFWTETGLLGLAVFLLLTIRSFRLLMTGLLSKNFFWGLGLICALSYWVVHGLVDVPYFKNDLSVEFWTILGLVQLWSDGQLT